MTERDLSLTRELIDFIQQSPIAARVVENAAARLEAAGYVRWDFNGEPLQKGGNYYVTRNGTSILAFRLPRALPQGFMISAAHSDSPLFKLKANYAIEACKRYLKLDTEPYGGGIYASWFDRPLSIAGRVVLRDGDTLSVRTVVLDEDLCVIPNVCIHFNREVNKGVAINAAVDTLPLIGDAGDAELLEARIAEALDVQKDAIVSKELFVYNRMPGTIFGLGSEYFAAPRIDDQQCAFATLQAFLQSAGAASVPVMAIFDNEEVGSSTKQGAASDLLRDTLTAIAALYEKPLSALLPSSMLLSCDNAHAIHPNHPEYSDEKNAPRMNDGIVIKHNANQKYTTDAVSEALFVSICERAGVPVQHYSNRSDLPGGSTLGSIASARVSMNSVDIGLAQLAMHSAYETAGVKDTAYLIDAAKAFFESSIRCDRDGVYRLA